MKVNSYNEWGTLKEVIVGSADNMTVGLEFPQSASISQPLIEKARRIAKKAHPGWYVDEVKEDLQDLCKILADLGVKVFRPNNHGASNLFSTTNWCSTGKDLYNVRDLHLVIGDTVIASSSPARCRYFEPQAFYDIWYNYFEQGFKWITAPRPKLVGDYLIPYYAKGEEITTREDVLHGKLSSGRTEKYRKLLEDEILFDAACTIRMGRDLIYLVSNTGNYKGAKWLQSIIGSQYKVHTTTAYRSSHIDSTILPLRPGLVLLNSARVNSQNCLSIFDKWKKIYFEDVAPLPNDELEFQNNVRDKVYRELAELGVNSDLHEISSPWGGINVFSFDSQTVLVHDRQKKLIRELEKNKLTVIPVPMRHCYTMLGGLHCATLDTVRDSSLESYFD